MSVYRPDSDAPQVKKTSTEKAGGTQDYTSAGQGVVFEINRGSGRKDFPGRLERRQLIEFELMSSGWLKSEPLGVGSWGNLTGGSSTDTYNMCSSWYSRAMCVRERWRRCTQQSVAAASCVWLRCKKLLR